MPQILPAQDTGHTSVANSEISHLRPQLIKGKQTSKKVHPLAEIRRTASSPQIRGMVQGIDSASLSGDKRRNKLGYQRTTIACGHCRRRKIRCLLPTPEDPQGRCANCIRLKKECNFHPVDHTAELRTGRKDSTAGGSPGSTSSPHTPIPPGHISILESQTGTPFDQAGSIPPPNSDDFNPSFINGNRSLSMPYMTGGISNGQIALQPTFTLSSADDGPEWSGPGFPPHSLSQSSPSSNYWASGENTPNTSTFPTNLINQAASTYGNSPLGFPAGTHSWAPSRSSSFSGFETLQQSYTYPDLPQPSDLSSYPLATDAPHTSSLSPPSIHRTNAGAPHLLPSGDLPSSLQLQQHPPPWMSPGNLQQASSSASPWFAEPGSMLNPELQEHIRDPFSNTGSPVYPSRSSTS